MTKCLWTGFIFITGVLLLQVSADAQTPVPENDIQSWNDIQVTIPLTKKTDFVFLGTVRLDGNLTSFVDERLGIRVNHAVQKYITLQGLYFHRDARPPNGRHEREERVAFGANFRVPLGKFTLNTRNWFERRWRHPQVDAWRYRNRIQLDHPFKISQTKFTWFISDEFFYDWSLHGWVRNRAALGVTHTFNKHFAGELYYMRQNDGRSRPGDINVIGTTLRLKL
jgi:Protein of unknown function (DUF2490)